MTRFNVISPKRGSYWVSRTLDPGGFSVSFSATYVLTIALDDPPFPLAAGAGLQLFEIAVRKSAAGLDPDVRVDLYQSGTLLATCIATAPVTDLSRMVLSGTWNASLLSSLSAGAGVEARVISTTHQKGINVDVGAFSWTPTLTN